MTEHGDDTGTKSDADAGAGSGDANPITVTVTVYGPLRSATGAKTVEVAVDCDERPCTVSDVLAAFVATYPRARPQLFADGSIRNSVRVGLDGERAPPDGAVRDGASMTLHPAVQGG